VIAPHTQPFAACFYILEGSGTVSIADAEIPVVAGELIEAAANLPRGIRNSGTGPLSLLVIKTTAVT
jgi:mannose-6-phosphate isomerase-like protein (cupin superfamily)